MTLDDKKGLFKEAPDERIEKVDLKETASQSEHKPLVQDKLCEPDPAPDLQLTSDNDNSDKQHEVVETQSSRLQLSTADLRHGEIVIPYQPFASTEKWVKYRFSVMSVPKAWFALVMVVLFFAFNGPDTVMSNLHMFLPQPAEPQPGFLDSISQNQSVGPDSGLVLQLFFGGIVALIAATIFLYTRQPTHVVLTADGLGLEWRRKSRHRAVTLPWSKMERIDLAWPAGKTSPQDCMIKFKGSSLENLSAEYPIILKLGAIAKEEDRDKLLRALETWAPDVHRDAQLLEILTPAQDHSYTELWLQALSAPPKRERLTPLSPGSRLQESRYEVYDQLGVGGQGTAYLAMDHKSMHEVVLKEFILPVYVDTNVRRQALERMQNEAAMLRKLDNNRIVRLWDFFVEDHRGYLVLEKIDGVSLQQIVESRGKQSESEVQSLALQMCDMLSYLHGLNPPVIHRDFTPDNLILNKDGILKLVDFNVAQQTEATATGTVVGKHAYISPEQFRGRPTPQSDVYSLGATLFYLLTGEAPEPIRASHPKSQRPDVSVEMDAIVARATAFDTKKRYANVQELKNDLKALK